MDFRINIDLSNFAADFLANEKDRFYAQTDDRRIDIFTANVGCLSHSFYVECDSHEECRIDKDTGSFVLGQQWRRTTFKCFTNSSCRHRFSGVAAQRTSLE